ncbi:hypothetical protein Dimus_007041 [Dionaea muscipula]
MPNADGDAPAARRPRPKLRRPPARFSKSEARRTLCPDEARRITRALSLPLEKTRGEDAPPPTDGDTPPTKTPDDAAPGFTSSPDVIPGSLTT